MPKWTPEVGDRVELPNGQRGTIVARGSVWGFVVLQLDEGMTALAPESKLRFVNDTAEIALMLMGMAHA